MKDGLSNLLGCLRRTNCAASDITDECLTMALYDLLELKAFEPTPQQIANATKMLEHSISHFKAKVHEIDTEYMECLADIVESYTQFPENVEMASILLENQLPKLQVFHDLLDGKINPTQVRATKSRMLGEYLVELGFVNDEQLKIALEDQKSGNYPGKRVGDILQSKGIITRSQLDQAIEKQMLDTYE